MALIAKSLIISRCIIFSNVINILSSNDLPLYFLDKFDVNNIYGRIRAKATTATELLQFKSPPLNYTAGATIFAAFQNKRNNDVDEYEIWAAVGRPGEPKNNDDGGNNIVKKSSSSIIGVSIFRFTTTDLIHYSKPSELLFLENGSGSPPGMNDGNVWTVKSMDRDSTNPAKATYVLVASYFNGIHTFINSLGPVTDTNHFIFTPTTGTTHTSNFLDHDDANIIYDIPRKRWIDMQIEYENLTQPKRYCDNVLGCRRTVSARIGLDLIGENWTSDLGCLDRPQTGSRCQTGFNISNMVRPNDAARIKQGRLPDEDPPELEFYRIRPFRLPGQPTRIAAHVLLYVPSPSDVVQLPEYGRQPLWHCTSGCCHGPHMYEEWWIGPDSGNPIDMEGWRRPYDLETRAFPHDIWAMEQPVSHQGYMVWVDNGHVWGIPEHRLAGLNSVSNGEFSSKFFLWPEVKKPNNSNTLWLEVDAKWGEKPEVGPEWCKGGCNGVGGSDEAHAAYVQVEIRDSHGKVIPGYEKKDATFTNVNGRVKLNWKNGSIITPGTKVQAHVYFRDATIYALGFD